MKRKFEIIDSENSPRRALRLISSVSVTKYGVITISKDLCTEVNLKRGMRVSVGQDGDVFAIIPSPLGAFMLTNLNKAEAFSFRALKISRILSKNTPSLVVFPAVVEDGMVVFDTSTLKTRGTEE